MSNTSHDLEPSNSGTLDPTENSATVADMIRFLFRGGGGLNGLLARAQILSGAIAAHNDTDPTAAVRQAELGAAWDRLAPFLMNAQTTFLPFQAEAPNQPPTQPDPSAVVEGSLEPVDEAA